MTLKKITAVLLAGALSLSAVFLVDACQASAKDSKKTISFSYPDGAFNDEEMSASVVYSDGYFTKSATKKQDALALLSMAAAAAVYKEEDIKGLLTDCGFTDTRYTVSDDDSNNLTFDIGKKKVGKKTVVAVVLEGTSESSEWYSNLRLGSGTVHDGFNITEKAVRKKLSSYLSKNGLKKGSVLFWVSGHSRGGAVGNLLAKRLSDSYGKSSVYAYTFASPKLTKSREKATTKYTNIFNYINPDDLVTTLPPANSDDLVKTLQQMDLVGSDVLLTALTSSFYQEYGTYRRYGIDIEMTEEDYDLMVQTFTTITGSDFDETSVEHEHCQSCYLSWLMG